MSRGTQDNYKRTSTEFISPGWPIRSRYWRGTGRGAGLGQQPALLLLPLLQGGRLLLRFIVQGDQLASSGQGPAGYTRLCTQYRIIIIIIIMIIIV